MAAMAQMFSKAEKFNQPLGDWNVSQVTTMRGMFADARAFNHSLEIWAVSNVTDISDMFRGTIEEIEPAPTTQLCVCLDLPEY